MALLLLVSLVQILIFQRAVSIVNLNQQTANPTRILGRPLSVDRGPNATNFGIDCLDEVSKIFFTRREQLTRSFNLVLTSAKKMNGPTAQIQDGFMKLLNEAVTRNKTQKLFKLRIVSDKQHKNRSQLSEYNHLYLADFYVIVVDSVERLKILLEICADTKDSWNPGARFLVLYNNAEERECVKSKNQTKNLLKIEGYVLPQNENVTQDECQSRSQNETIMEIYKQMLQKYYIHRIAVLYATDAFNYTLSSMDYLSKRSCRTIMSSKIGNCNRGKMYPDKFTIELKMRIVQDHTNSENCTFNVCATIAAPFVERDCKTGLELRIIEFIKNRLKLNIVTECTVESRGVQQQQQQDNWTGLLGKLKMGNCDFIIGGYYPDNDVTRAFWTSQCYMEDTHTWFIKLADERPPWMALYTIFDETIWECFLIMTPITWIFWYFLSKILPEPKEHKEFSLIGVNNIGMSICVAVNERPLCHASRIFWFALAVYGLNITTLYTSRLIVVFANPGYLHQIDNLNEVIKAGIPFGGPEECADWFENEDDMWIFKQYNDTDLFDPNSANLEFVKDGKRVILSSRLYIIQHNVSDKVYGFPENVFANALQMIMKPGFPFMFEINRLITYMNDAGIFNRFLSRFYFNNTYLKRISKLRPQFKETVIVITMDHLQSPFLIWGIGIACSIIILLIEICMEKRLDNRKKFKIEKRKYKNGKRKRTTSKKRQTKISKEKTLRKVRRSIPIYTHVGNFYGKVQHGIRFTPILSRKIGNQRNERNN